MASEHNYTQSFSVEGMTCASCVRIVERSLKKLDGISYVSVNLATEKALVLSDVPIDQELVRQTVEKTGYGYQAESPAEDVLTRRFKAARKRFILALGVTIPLMVLMILHMSGIHIPGFLIVELVGASFVLFYPGLHVLSGAWIAVSHRHTNMDTLVSLGAVFSWITIPFALAGLPIMSFGSISAMLIAFHLTGRYIESRLKYRAASDIRSLIGAQEKDALLITPEGKELSVPVEAVKPGSIILVKTGGRIPLDGIVKSGSALVDQSMISGEPVPVRCDVGSEVIGGTLITQGVITVEITRVGEDTFLANMIKLIEEAQAASVPIQAFADRLTNIFIPVVLALAVISAGFWWAFYPSLQGYLQAVSSFLPWVMGGAGAFSSAAAVFVAVLVIACPCALGLATPMALIAGSGAAARRGIIIKDGEAIQGAKDIEVILLDKTGTLTAGRPTVSGTDLELNDLLAAAAVESFSTHPLASAIVEYAVQQSADRSGDRSGSLSADRSLPKAEQADEVAGKGITGVVGKDTYRIGRPPAERADYARIMQSGATVVAVWKNEEPLGYIAIADAVKPEAKAVIGVLKKLGITPVMVTGDQEVSARAVAALVGIDTVHAGLHPEDKLEILRSYQKQGRKTAMVGDGINDAAVLKASDLGIALGTGTDLSIESADAVIVSGSLTRIPDTMDISRLTFRKIRQNLFWALFYNAVALPLAMAGLLHPAIAEVAMTLSSINVIVNSMRIRAFVPQLEDENTYE
jgi:P-type Cu+ transporter